ncbi:TonB-dependent receptor [Flavivirga eckloniae]|uniref:TonB-dependent receptor n=1 Tax=Flavivirga eckloniae TaxID=1803846 RepID=A0A2K9PXA5_9FLAO|nr:carboxypeptidase-like regulatory domain-containing protein [Flavivirga eckloniae]AUP81468.1 TonB-dependent receptor [Flavivirga eckloniae]
MKHALIILLCVLSFNFNFSQEENDQKISLQYENVKKIDVIKRIESLTDYRFLFLEEWIDDIPISVQYSNVSIRLVLDDIFKLTDINYYIKSDNNIILTKNSLINSKLPKDYFNNTKTNSYSENHPSPILYTNPTLSENDIDQTIKIGKENNRLKQSTYVLSGYVKNITTNRPIANLVIVTADKKINTQTDEKGYYSIELPYGVNIIETKGLGLSDSKKRIIMYSNGKFNFNLSDDIELLDEVVIEANKDKNVKEALTGVLQIKAKEIKTIPLVLGERDILKIATTLPGIKTAGEGSSGYNVRGGKEDQNLILLDNGVLYNPTHFFGIFSALNPFTSGDVNIYKGNIPSEFGGRLSSVFDIKTKNGNTEKFSGEASIGPVTSNITIETPVIKNKSSLMVGARGTYSQWILRSLDDESLKNSKASFYDFVGKYRHKINDKNSIEATGYYSKDAFSITSDSLFGYSNRLMSLKWDHTFNDKNIGNFIVSNSEYRFNIEHNSNLDKNFDLGYRVNETEFKIRMKYLMNKKYKFDYGISSKLYSINPGSIDPKGSESIVQAIEIPKERALESALYLSGNFELSNKLLLNLGVRYSMYAALGEAEQRIYQDNSPRNVGSLIETQEFDKNEIIKTYGGPEFRMSARYFLDPSLSIKGGFNTTYQYIHNLTNNTTVSPTDTWRLSDINIKPQQASQFSLGIYKNLNENLYELSVEGYYKKSKNILDYKVGADLILNQTIETEVLQGEGKAYGIEFLIRKTKGKLNGWLGYTYSRSFIKLASEFAEEQVNNGNFFASNFDKPHDISLVANYKLTRRFSFSSNFTYQTGRPVTFPTGSYILNGVERVLYSDRNKFRIPDYYRLDLGLNIEGNHKIKKLAHSFWNISVYNVLGRNNPYSVFFVTENGNIQAYQSSIFAIPVPTITYNLKF